jgi:Circularly permutated YpsA SLOG family
MALMKIVSGGQTGVDRGALDAALVVGFPCGGWCPEDRRAEDGPIPERYPMTPLPGGRHRERTHQNVIDSDGTVILYYRSLTGGTLLAHEFFVLEKKPFIVLDATKFTESDASDAIVRFIEEHDIKVLNVAGPRLSGWVTGYVFALAVIGEVIRRGREK